MERWPEQTRHVAESVEGLDCTRTVLDSMQDEGTRGGIGLYRVLGTVRRNERMKVRMKVIVDWQKKREGEVER